MKIQCKQLSTTAILPTYKTEDAVGMDLSADIFYDPITGEEFTNECKLTPGKSVIAKTNITMEIPKGYEGQIRSRSGLAFNDFVTAFHGTIDSDYRGSINVLLTHNGFKSKTFKKGERIAQLVIAPIIKAELERVETISTTERNDKGFGSTGK